MSGLDFRAELEKLLALEDEPAPDLGVVLAEAFSAGREDIERFDIKQSEISLQIEEIYDLVRESETGALLEALRDGRRRESRLVKAVAGLCDIVEDFKEYAVCGNDEALARQALMMWRGTDKLLEECGMARIGESGGEGQPLDPAVHTAQAAEPSNYPKGHLSRLLRSGYRHGGEIARKAVVVVSSGMVCTGTEDLGDE